VSLQKFKSFGLKSKVHSVAVTFTKIKKDKLLHENLSLWPESLFYGQKLLLWQNQIFMEKSKHLSPLSDYINYHS